MKRFAWRFLLATPALLGLGIIGCYQGSVGVQVQTSPSTPAVSSTQSVPVVTVAATSEASNPAETQVPAGTQAIVLSVPGMA